MLPAWNLRPQVTANLNNPAFCCEIIRLCAKEYKSESSQSFPFALSIFILPLILPSMFRSVLPRSKRTSLHSWLNEHEGFQVILPEQIMSFIPFTKETIMFGIMHDVLRIGETGEIEVVSQKSPYKADDDEVKECISKAGLVGRMFAKAGDQTTIYSLFGIKP